MSETFGFRLKRFALAVDIVDDQIFQQTWELILEYIRLHLRVDYWALLVEAPVNQRPGLAALYSRLGQHSFTLTNGDDSYNGPAAYSFLEGKPVWGVAQNQEPLGPETAMRDDWCRAENLFFDRPATEGVRTVILIPLRDEKGRKVGLLDLQSRDHLERTPRLAAELQNLADTLAILLPLWELNEERRAHTLKAISLHRIALADAHWPPLAMPQIFVASSEHADEAVMGEILSVLDGFRVRVHVHYWKENFAGGNITVAMLQQIQASQFGLCYFSEPAPGGRGEPAFRDNENVLFEAGLLHAWTGTAPGNQSAWIPVREPSSPPPPFDFAQDRILVVPRGSDGRLMTDVLVAKLKARLDVMLALVAEDRP